MCCDVTMLIQTPLDKNSQVFTALDYWIIPMDSCMGLKGPGPYFHRSMASVVLAGLDYINFEIYIDDVEDLRTNSLSTYERC